MEFKSGKYKDEIFDKYLLFIINRCTNKKYSTYEDLNEFIEDLNFYIEYGCVSSKSHKNVNEELDYEYDEMELYENHYKITPMKLIRNIGACVLLLINCIKLVTLAKLDTRFIFSLVIWSMCFTIAKTHLVRKVFIFL